MNLQNASIGYINESELVDIREVDIEVLDIGDYVIGVQHSEFHEFDQEFQPGGSPSDLIYWGADFVMRKSDQSFEFHDYWTTASDADRAALKKAVIGLMK
jgi:hypothetical protein